MNPGLPQSSWTARIGEFTLWSIAGIIVLTAHIAAATVFLRQEPTPAADQGPPAAIMIELAAEPEAINTEEDLVSEEIVDSEEVASKQVEPVVDPLPEPIPEPVPEPIEPDPPEEVVEPVEPIEPTPVEPPPLEEPEIVEETPEPLPEPQIDPLEQQMLAALENVEVPLPVSRPPSPKKKIPPKKVAPKQQPQASKAAREAKLEAKQSERTAARRTSEGSSAPSVSPAKWQSKLMAHIRRRQRYPRSARANGETGTPRVRFRIDQSGNVLSVSLTRSSGSASLDEAAISLIQRASPVPAPPPGVSTTITAPIEYVLR